MPVDPRGLARDPLAFSVRERSAAVQACSDFHAHPGPSASHAREKPDVELACLRFSQPLLDRDSRGAQFREAGSRDLRIRILNRSHHTRYAGIDDGVRARRSSAVMAARFQVHVQCRATRARPGCLQCQRLRVRHSGLLMPARADDRPVPDDEAADARIGCRGVEAAPGEVERLSHEFMVGGRHHHFSMRRARLAPGFFTSSIASRKSSTR